MECAVELGAIDANPMIGVKRPGRPRKRYLSGGPGERTGPPRPAPLSPDERFACPVAAVATMSGVLLAMESSRSRLHRLQPRSLGGEVVPFAVELRGGDPVISERLRA
jgi:hypothetical protein